MLLYDTIKIYENKYYYTNYIIIIIKGLAHKGNGKNGISLVHTVLEQYRITAMVSRQGYLDGITQSDETVDNLPWSEHERTFGLMQEHADLQIA